MIKASLCKIIGGIAISISIFTLGVCGVVAWQKDYEICKELEYRSLKRTSEYWDKTFKVKRGWCHKNYLYISIDSGKQWFSAKQTENGYEQLVSVTEQNDSTFRHIVAFYKLMDYVAKHGPIDPTNPKQAKLLEGIGITVVNTNIDKKK